MSERDYGTVLYPSKDAQTVILRDEMNVDAWIESDTVSDLIDNQ